MPKRGGPKSVSFQHVNETQKTLEQELQELEKTAAQPKYNFPTLKHSVVTIPYHYLLVLYGMFKFGITSDVQGVLLKGLFTLIPLQIIYNALLLQNLKKKSHNVPLLIGGSIFISGILSLPLFVSLLVFGAPLATHLTETYLLSLHISVLVFNPLLVLFKIDFEAFSNVFRIEKVYRLVFSNQVLSSSFLGLVGTWIGVIPIPLDWDRPWQQWPITLLAGAYVGSVVGGIVSLFVHNKPATAKQ